MNIHQAFEAIYKAARRAPLDADSHEVVKEALKFAAQYIIAKEKEDEPKTKAGGVHKEQRSNPHQSDV